MTYLYITDLTLDPDPNPDAPQPEPIIKADGQTIAMGQVDDKLRYLSSKEHEAGTLVGRWHNNGDAVIVVPELYQQYFKDFANDENGFATDSLNVHYWQGHKQRNLQEVPVNDTLPEYPADEQPFVVTMERFEVTDGAWPGWYWRAIIEFVDPNREPTNRAIGIYDYEWNYEYTTGAFVLTDMPGPPNDDGEPTVIQKYVTECPPGRQTTEPVDIFYALLHGAAQEGKMIIQSETMQRVDYFWEE